MFGKKKMSELEIAMDKVRKVMDERDRQTDKLIASITSRSEEEIKKLRSEFSTSVDAIRDFERNRIKITTGKEVPPPVAKFGAMDEYFPFKLERDNSRDLIFMGSTLAKLTSNGPSFLSLAFINSEDEEFYIEMDYNPKDVDEWTTQHVLPDMMGGEMKKSTKHEAVEALFEFLRRSYGDNTEGSRYTKPLLVADVTPFKWLALCDLLGVWDLPFAYIPLDIASLLFASGYDVDAPRLEVAEDLGVFVEQLSNPLIPGYPEIWPEIRKHNALYQARLARDLYNKLSESY